MTPAVNKPLDTSARNAPLCVLAFDGCLRGLSVTVLTRDGQLVTRRDSADTGDQAERLMPLIDETRAAAGLAWTDIDQLAVTLGPGGFTSVRVVVAAARALSLALAKPAVGISTLQLLALSALDEVAATTRRIVIVIPAGKGGVYTQAFDRYGVELGPAVVVEASELAMLVAPDDALAGPGVAVVLESYQGHLPPQTGTLAALEPSTERLATYGRHLTLEAELRPIYLRAADAKPQTGIGLTRA